MTIFSLFLQIVRDDRYSTPTIVRSWSKWLYNWVADNTYLDDSWTLTIMVVLFAVIGWVMWKVSRLVLLKVFNRIADRTKTSWDDALVHNRFFKRLAQSIPGVFAYWVIPDFFGKTEALYNFLNTCAEVYLIFIGLYTLFALLNSVREILEKRESLQDKPIRSYVQLIKLSLTLVAFVYLVSALAGVPLLQILTGLGAVTAILLLLFKDTILGLVASVQMSSIDLVKKGDWISMDKYGADGDVIEINLTSVKVQNWDKTITTIPAYALVSESFKNWRGMQVSGGRRIKRKLDIKTSSIHFADEAFRQKVSKLKLLTSHLEKRQAEINDHNNKHGFDPKSLDARRMTNIGIFRAYAQAYLNNHPAINQEMTCMVRQLEPSGSGLPLEIYAFSREKEWEIYESIMSDIFDHLISAVPFFELELFQEPTGTDFARFSKNMEGT